MNQLKNLINRSGVPTSKPDKNMKAAEDFLLLLLHAHVVAAAKKILEFEGFESVAEVAQCIVNTYLLIPSGTCAETDGVHLYAKELMTLSMVWHYFHDSSREADGDRLKLSWKILIPIFYATKRRNYLKEGVNLLLQCCVLSERKVGQLLWSRCVNTHGRAGCNVPVDLHQEHLNRTLKSSLRSLGANLTFDAIARAGKSLATVHNVCTQFEQETVPSAAASGVHNVPGFGKDFRRVLAQLLEDDVMETKESRSHKTFTLKEGLLQKSADKALQKRIKYLIDTIVAA